MLLLFVIPFVLAQILSSGACSDDPVRDVLSKVSGQGEGLVLDFKLALPGV